MALQLHKKLRLRAQTIRGKILLVAVASTALALVLSAAALLYYEIRTYREIVVQDLSTEAEILARTSGPTLAFQDQKAAQADLNALRGKRNIRAAALFDRDNQLFAGFTEEGEPALATTMTLSDGRLVKDDAIQVTVPVIESSERLGTVYLRSEYDLGARVSGYLVILIFIMASSLLVAFLFSTRLQRSLTGALRALTESAQHVVKEREFRRVEKTTDDEIGMFVEAFNSMVEELDARAKALESTDRKKDEFLATLAHELRNPLSPIVNATTIFEKSVDPVARQKALEMLNRQVKHMVRLVNDLLDVSRITTGKLSLRLERLDLRQIITQAADSIRSSAEAQHQMLHVDKFMQPVWVNADETRLTQVFTNLLHNATKYTPMGGSISVRIKDEGDVVAVQIADTGIGVAASRLTQIFDMFTQLENPLERSRAGLGVGLALAKRLVDLHHGTIEAASDGANRGTTFTVRLPRTKDVAVPRVVAADVGGVDIERHRILLVDDNEDYADSLAILLRDAGHDVRVAYEGRAALLLVRNWTPRLACLDIGMPGMSGYELARRLRDESRCVETILVAITGWGQQHDRLQSQAAGFDHHLVKPVSPDAILALLANPSRAVERVQ